MNNFRPVHATFQKFPAADVSLTLPLPVIVCAHVRQRWMLHWIMQLLMQKYVMQWADAFFSSVRTSTSELVLGAIAAATTTVPCRNSLYTFCNVAGVVLQLPTQVAVTAKLSKCDLWIISCLCAKMIFHVWQNDGEERSPLIEWSSLKFHSFLLSGIRLSIQANREKSFLSLEEGLKLGLCNGEWRSSTSSRRKRLFVLFWAKSGFLSANLKASFRLEAGTGRTAPLVNQGNRPDSPRQGVSRNFGVTTPIVWWLTKYLWWWVSGKFGNITILEKEN